MSFVFETVPTAEVTLALRAATAPSTVLVRTADEQLTTIQTASNVCGVNTRSSRERADKEQEGSTAPPEDA